MGKKNKFRRLFWRVSAIGLAAIFTFFAAGCKKAEDEAASPLAPPAWIQGSWADQGYTERSASGSRWEFTQDNAIYHDYMYGQPHLAPWDYFQFYLDCLHGKEGYEYEYSLTDSSSDTYYEIHTILASIGGSNPYETTHRFIKLTPTTFRYIILSNDRSNDDFGVFTKE